MPAVIYFFPIGIYELVLRSFIFSAISQMSFEYERTNIYYILVRISVGKIVLPGIERLARVGN